MHFMTVGDTNYFFLIRENCIQVRALYPDAPVLIYDFGLTDAQRADLRETFAPVEIIGWRKQLDKIPEAWQALPDNQKRKLALAFNARRPGWRARLRKAIFKRFPNSSVADAMRFRALRFENLLIQKIACMRDASDRVGNQRFVFLDADAMLFKPIDDAFAENTDVTLTLLSNPSWAINACFVINSGVIFYGPDAPARNALLDNWWREAQENDEWLREQSALTRMLERQGRRDDFIPEGRIEIELDGTPLRIDFKACDEYNYFEMDNTEPPNLPDARIYHFTDRRQRPEVFREYMTYLRTHRGVAKTPTQDGAT